MGRKQGRELQMPFTQAGEERRGWAAQEECFFKTKKEMLALKGEERKQVPVAGGGFLEGGALSGLQAGGGLGWLGPLWGHFVKFQDYSAASILFISPRSLNQMDVQFPKGPWYTCYKMNVSQ
jgi:hypothetical protein